jgi:hypothetical protein
VLAQTILVNDLRERLLSYPTFTDNQNRKISGSDQQGFLYLPFQYRATAYYSEPLLYRLYVSHCILCDFFMFFAVKLSDIRNTYYIGEDSGGRYCGSGSVSFDDHRVFIVALGGDHDDIITTFQFIERVRTIHFL